jgi:hypothetical protein
MIMPDGAAVVITASTIIENGRVTHIAEPHSK